MTVSWHPRFQRGAQKYVEKSHIRRLCRTRESSGFEATEESEALMIIAFERSEEVFGGFKNNSGSASMETYSE